MSEEPALIRFMGYPASKDPGLLPARTDNSSDGPLAIMARSATDHPADMLAEICPTTFADLAAPATQPKDRDFIRVGRSRIEGTGVFAKRRIHRGARIIEYIGDRVLADRLLAPAGGTVPSRVYTFRLNETIVIDGARGGNASRFINHSCAPNCEAYAFDDRMYIYAQVDIARGEELTFDYKLAPPDGRRAKSGPDEHACACGATNCRGTMRRTRHKS